MVDVLIALLRKGNIDTIRLDKDLALEALLSCWPAGRVSFAGALVWGAARSETDAAVCSLDGRFLDEGVRVLRAAGGGSA